MQVEQEIAVPKMKAKLEAFGLLHGYLTIGHEVEEISVPFINVESYWQASEGLVPADPAVRRAVFSRTGLMSGVNPVYRFVRVV